MSEEKIKIELTGNPFVDTGLSVIAALAGLEELDNFTLKHIVNVFRDGSQLVGYNSKLKAFTQIFGTNNPLYQSAYGYKKGKGPSDDNIAIYKSTLKGFVDEIGKSNSGPRCWACGMQCEFDFDAVCRKAIEGNGKTPPGEEKMVGRDWFPLAGSIGSDAQALPGASQPSHICPKCLLAVHYLPLGLLLLGGRLAVFQSASFEFWYELIRDIVNEVKRKVLAGNYETLGKKEGSQAVIKRLLAWFRRLQGEKRFDGIPKGTNLYVWRFSNSGTSPDCQIEEIPNKALVFLWKAVDEGLMSEIESLVSSEGKNPYFSLFRCVAEGRDYPNLYPEKRKKGASPQFFALYQTYVRNHSSKALQIAYKLAKEISEQVREKEFKRLQRPEAFKERKVQNLFRSSMVEMASKGELALKDYLDLFPTRDTQGITVEWDGWNLIRYYLHHTDEEDELWEVNETRAETKRFGSVKYYAGKFYNHYLTERGKERFQREVLAQIKQGKIGIPWLRLQFAQLAELHEGFTYAHWSKLCKLENGQLFVSELLFQMRLLWTQWICENQTSINISTSIDGESINGLPERIKNLIELIFTNCVDRRGLDRFYRDILLRFHRKEIGFFWFRGKLAKQISEDIQPLTEEEWEEFLVDSEGQSIKSERLFQLHLAFANLYRTERFKEKTREVMK